MTIEVVLDGSALLAMLRDERGGAEVASSLAQACILSVNLAEVATRLVDAGAHPMELDARLGALPLPTIAFDRALALDAAALRIATVRRGLSLGDRACLALARRDGLPVLTADRAWEGLDIGVEIRLIR